MKGLRKPDDFVLLILGLGLIYFLYAIPTTDWTARATPTPLPATPTVESPRIVGHCLAPTDVDYLQTQPLPTLPVQEGDPIPYSAIPITADNVSSIRLLARWGTIAEGQSGTPVNDIRLHDNGKLVAIASDSGLQFRDVATGVITCHTAGVDNTVEVDFHPGQNLFAVKNDRENVQIWDLKEPDGSKPLWNTDSASALHFLNTGSLGLLDAATHRYMLWDVKTNNHQIGFLSSAPVESMVFRFVGNQKSDAEIGKDTITVTTGRPAITTTLAPQMTRLHADFSSDAAQLAIGGNSGIQLWDTHTGKQPWASTDARLSPVNDIQFSPNGAWVATATQDNVLWLWDSRDGSLLARLEGHDAKITAVEVAPDATFILTASTDGTVGVWGIAPVVR